MSHAHALLLHRHWHAWHYTRMACTDKYHACKLTCSPHACSVQSTEHLLIACCVDQCIKGMPLILIDGRYEMCITDGFHNTAYAHPAAVHSMYHVCIVVQYIKHCTSYECSTHTRHECIMTSHAVPSIRYAPLAIHNKASLPVYLAI